jgi:hypothetical protein
VKANNTQPFMRWYDGEMEETDKPPVRHSGRMRSVVIVLVLALLVYPLSSGPVAVLAFRTRTTVFWSSVYVPLYRLSVATGSNRAFSSYIQWWIEVTDTTYYTKGSRPPATH